MATKNDIDIKKDGDEEFALWAVLLPLLSERMANVVDGKRCTDNERIAEVRRSMCLLTAEWRDDMCKAVIRYLRTGELVNFYDSKVMAGMQRRIVRLINESSRGLTF